MSSKSFPGVLEDMGVPDKVGIGVRGLGLPLGSIPKSFNNIGHLESCQDSSLPSSVFMFSSLFMSFKSLPGVLEDMEDPDKVGNGIRGLGLPLGSIPKSFIKIEHLKPCHDSQCPSSLFLESWRTWRFLTKLEMVSGGWDYP